MGDQAAAGDAAPAAVPEPRYVVPTVTVPATVTTSRALRDEADALARVDALVGRATIVHRDDEVDPHEQPVVDRLRDQATALGRVNDLHQEPELVPAAAVRVSVVVPGALLHEVEALARRSGRTVDDLCVAGFELVMGDAGQRPPSPLPIDEEAATGP